MYGTGEYIMSQKDTNTNVRVCVCVAGAQSDVRGGVLG